MKYVEKDFETLTDDQYRKLTIGKLLPETEPQIVEVTKND